MPHPAIASHATAMLVPTLAVYLRGGRPGLVITPLFARLAPWAAGAFAEELEGRLRCESAGPGQGAIFIIELPLCGQGGREALV